MMSLIPRKPNIATPDPHLDWSPTPEFAHILNGSSVMIPFVEHYLNNLMKEIREGYCCDKPELAEELSQFIQQEAIHARYHMIFNKRMFDQGYEGLKPLIERLNEDLHKLRQARSIGFNAAYCAGFETTATFSAKYLLERCDAFFRGADSYGANLLQWHVAEEYEHRATCHRAFEAVSGNYFIRIAGLVYSFWHINRLFGRAGKVILAKHREGMTRSERRRSERVERKLVFRQMVYLLPRMTRLLVPFYDPARLRVPSQIAKALEFFKSNDPIKMSFADMRDGLPEVG